MELTVEGVIRIARRRWWLFILATILAGAAFYASASRQEKVYSTSATFLVVSGQPEVEGQLASLQASTKLAQTYQLLIETGPVLDRVNAKLRLPYDIAALEDVVSTSIIGDSPLVKVTVTDNDPERAALIANTILEQFQLYLGDQASLQMASQVEVADPARVPTSPISPQPMRSLLIGLFLGAALGVLLIGLLEYLDDTVKPDRDIRLLVDAPVLARVPMAARMRHGTAQAFVLNEPRSGAAEALRLLRANLEFAAATEPITTLAISSPGPQEGKSTIAANLAIVMAQAGLRTVLVDADLRNPQLHRIFGYDTFTGLSTLLKHPDTDWRSIARPTDVEGLSVIPCGPVPPNPSDLLQSDRFSDLLNGISKSVDLVVLDTPPVLVVSDPLTVARRADAMVLVAKVGKTRSDAMRQASQAIKQANIRLAGVVLNQFKPHHSAYYYGRYYGSEAVAPDGKHPAGATARADVTRPPIAGGPSGHRPSESRSIADLTGGES